MKQTRATLKSMQKDVQDHDLIRKLHALQKIAGDSNQDGSLDDPVQREAGSNMDFCKLVGGQQCVGASFGPMHEAMPADGPGQLNGRALCHVLLQQRWMNDGDHCFAGLR